jgi:nickel-dependent lactate racemase
MSIIESLLRDVALPRMVAVRQIFPEDGLTDVATALRTELRAPQISARIRPGARIAIAVGSRGLADLPLLVSVVVDELKERGAAPFIVPAMGSHGGATAEGQKAVLAALGVTEASAGCPIVSSMETVELGTLDNGLPILMDRHAMEADGIVVINRVKPHTSFSGPSESGW